MIHRGRIGTLALLLFAIACGGGTDGTPTPTLTDSSDPTQSPFTSGPPDSPSTSPEPDSPFTEVTRSIVGIIPAIDIGDDGQPVDPGFTFAADTPQITIVALAGVAAASPMELTWFQITEDGDVELFAHTVEVATFQAAYSVGANPGTLASGTYRVDATFVGETSSTTFEVEASVTESAMASIAGAGIREGRVAGEGATSGPPVSGDSGAVATPVSEVSRGEPSVGLSVEGAPVDMGPTVVILQFNAVLPGGGGYALATVEMPIGGTPRHRSFPLTAEQDSVRQSLDFDPCVHPGGSDLPGTTASFTVNVFRTGDILAADDTIDTTLGPDKNKPIVSIDSQPPNKSRVERGQEIVLIATATEDRTGTWQEGLNSFKLIATPGGLVGEVQRSTAGSAQPCDSKQWSLESHATYTVPDDAPAVIKICGEALDFAGNFSDPDACNEYYTGEVWEGPLTGRAVIPGCDPNPVPITGELMATAASDGTVTGTVHEIRESFSCQGGPQSGVHDVTNSFTGTKTAEAFVLDVYGVTVNMPIVGTQAMGSSDHPGSGGHGVFYNYTLDCVSCEN